jgi:hypothetical protein
MTAPLTGFSATFASTDALLDSGVLYVGATVFGVTKGGLNFDPGVTYRSVEFDGKRSPVKLLDRKMMAQPKLSGTVIQLSTANVGQIEPGATTSATGAWTASTSYAPKRAAGLLAAGDYLTDVRAIWLRASGGFVQVRFPSALLTKYDIASQDADEVAVSLEIEARLDTGVSGFTNVGDAPYRIEYLASV